MRYQHQAGQCFMSGKNLFHVYDVLDGVQTMPMYFAQNGYETFGTGKWHNGAASFEASFQKGKNVFLGGMSDHNNVPCRDLGQDGKLSDPVNKGYSTDIFTMQQLIISMNMQAGKIIIHSFAMLHLLLHMIPVHPVPISSVCIPTNLYLYPVIL